MGPFPSCCTPSSCPGRLFAWYLIPGVSPEAAQVGNRASLTMRMPVPQAQVVMGSIFGSDTCLLPEMASSRGNLLKNRLPCTFGHLSFFCLILCPQLSLAPCLLGFLLLEALCWCPHNLFHLLNSFWRLIYITQCSPKWSRLGGLHKLIMAHRTSWGTGGLISILPQPQKARGPF